MPTRAEAPEIALGEDFWRHAKVTVPPGKTSVHLRVNADVLAWIKARGRLHGDEASAHRLFRQGESATVHM